jgi:glycerol-3-phosphate acyltransferase PlsY
MSGCVGGFLPQSLLIDALVCLGFGYLIGSVPFGLLAARMGGLGDIRNIGSGNIGATNVLRSGRKDLALITLVGDAGKGALAILLAWALAKGQPEVKLLQALAGGAAFVGHCFPIWLRFRGGKGVATFMGVMLAAWWPAGLLCGLTWLIVAAIFRISSLAALAAAALSAVFVFFTDGPYPVLWLALFLAVLIFVRHHQNIGRLLKGEEPRIGAKTA